MGRHRRDDRRGYVARICRSRGIFGAGWRLGTIVATERDGSRCDTASTRYATADGRISAFGSIRANARTEHNARRHCGRLVRTRDRRSLFHLILGHPRLGDFVLHDSHWVENVGLMRPNVVSPRGKAARMASQARTRGRGRFRHAGRADLSGDAESALFLLETVGEDVVRASPRLFYKYRAIEKLAEGRSAPDVLLLAERCRERARSVTD